MQPGSLGSHFDDRTNPLEKHATAMIEKGGFAPAPMAAQFFGNAGKVIRNHFEPKSNSRIFLA